jgi:polyferredoxin
MKDSAPAARIPLRTLPLRRVSPAPAAGLALAFGFLLLLLAKARGWHGTGAWLGLSAWSAASVWIWFGMLTRGRIQPYRFILFCLLALGTLCSLSFAVIPGLTEWSPQGGASVGPYTNICAISLVAAIGNLGAQLTKVIFSGAIGGWGFYYVLALAYLLFTLLLGTGWCAWVCGYGAWDETCSRAGAARPLWRLPGGEAAGWRYSGLGVLLAVALIAWSSREAVFCRWICPFKIGEQLWAGTAWEQAFQISLTAVVAAVFVIGLPALFGRRTFCRLVCPFGAWQSLVGRVHPFQWACAEKRCTLCGRCRDVCPMQAIDWDEKHGPRADAYCNRCGRCLDACPQGALGFVWGRRQADAMSTAVFTRTTSVYVLTALVVAGVIGMEIWANAGNRIWFWLAGRI